MKHAPLAADGLTSADAEAVIGACSRRAPTGIRNAALIAVLWRSGQRVSEALALVPADIASDTGVLHVRRGKGGKPRAVGLDAGTGALIARWLDVRTQFASTRQTPLFRLEPAPANKIKSPREASNPRPSRCAYSSTKSSWKISDGR